MTIAEYKGLTLYYGDFNAGFGWFNPLKWWAQQSSNISHLKIAEDNNKFDEVQASARYGFLKVKASF